MQEEVNQKVIALSIKSAKLTAGVLKAAMKMYLEHRKNKKENKHGKMKVKELVGQGKGAATIEINEGNIADFQKVAKKYHVDFAVKKEKTAIGEPSKYVVFFKGRDADVISDAFKEFVYKNEKKKNRVSVKAKLAQFKEVVQQRQHRERERTKNRNMENSLWVK